jgi:hypothetical protein
MFSYSFFGDYEKDSKTDRTKNHLIFTISIKVTQHCLVLCGGIS